MFGEEDEMEVLFICAGATVIATTLMAIWHRSQGQRFEHLTHEFVTTPPSRVVIRPAGDR